MTAIVVIFASVVVRAQSVSPGVRLDVSRLPARPVALVQAGNSKTVCISTGSGTWKAGLRAAEQATGIAFRCLETFSDADPTWSQWMDPWITHANSGIPEWVAADRRQRTLIVSEDLIPQSLTNDPDPITWEQPCAAGQFNGYARRFARALVSAGLGWSVIRLGKEANGGWEQDYVGQTSAEQHAWAQCFDQEVAAMRSVRGAHFLFDWNPNACTNALPLSNYYPGNAYVDIIGVDLYNADCATQLPGPSAWSWHLLYTESYGLAQITAFAEKKGKPMSIPEWGLLASPNGLADDPYYVEGIATYVQNHDVAFQSYFDSGANGVVQLGPSTPKALAAYRHAFG